MRRFFTIFIVISILIALGNSTAQTRTPARGQGAAKTRTSDASTLKPQSDRYPFEIVSAKRIDSIESRSSGNHLSWTDRTENGIVRVSEGHRLVSAWLLASSVLALWRDNEEIVRDSNGDAVVSVRAHLRLFWTGPPFEHESEAN